ncbi:MAG TPA: amidohydrolase [Ignavibacteria bacterium]|nr:amidohydrolase [Ignavibacteria bacterium]
MKTLFKNCKVWLGKNSFTNEFGIDDSKGKIIYIKDKTPKPDFENKIDLKNKLVLPSFMDGHCHLLKASIVNSELNLRNAKTKKDFKKIFAEYKTTTEWITGGYFSDSGITDGFSPDVNFLDAVAPDMPVLISRFDMHSGFANSKAIELSGLKSKLNEFKSDEVVRDGDGNLTGELKETALNYLLSFIPRKSIEELANNVKSEIEKLHSLGITSVADITLPFDLDVFEVLLQKNEFNLRIDSRLPFKEFQNLENYKKRFIKFNDWIKFQSFKAFYDGSLSSETAYFHKNYVNRNHNGLRMEIINSGEFEEIGFEIDKSDYQMSVHAIGDKSVTELLDFNEQLISKNGNKDRRFRIEHAQHIQDKDLKRFKELNVIASVQPAHLFSDAKTASQKVEDLKTTHRYKQLIDEGANVCYGTDFPIVDENPFETIYFAMTRKAEGFDKGFLPEYNISLDDCIKCYTEENAYASYNENNFGTIEVGKSADFIILDDLFQMNADEIRTAKVEQTYLKGKKIN